MSEVGTREWKVLGFRPGKTEPNPHGGQFQKFYVDFEGSPDTCWRRREGDEPEIGRAYYGTVSEGNYGPMFKKEKAPDGSTSSGGSKNYGGKSKEWTPEGDRDPEKVARIGRAHAQGMAVQTLTAMGAFEGKSAEQLHSTLKSWTDFYEQDVNEAAQKAGGGGTGNDPREASPPVDTPGPAQNDTGQLLDHLLEQAGVNYKAAGIIRDYALQEMSVEEQDAACNRLSKENTRAAAVVRLTERTEAALGEPLPGVEPDLSDVPF